jgi:metal-responsive CopG/Arc/MetJ family transcriptional regulator
MGRSTRVVNMSVDDNLYEDVDRLARERGTSRSQVLREALKQYVATEVRWSQLLKWGEETRQRLGVESDADVERIVHQYREERQ